MGKITLKLSSYNPFTIRDFLRRSINKDLVKKKELRAISKAVLDFKIELLEKITPEQIDNYLLETDINEILGYQN